MSSEMEKQLQILMDERAIMDAIVSYGHCLDYGLKDEFVDLFTDDGRLIYKLRGYPLPNVVVDQPQDGMTKEIIADYASKHDHAPDAFHKHCVSAPKIKLESDTKASATSYFFRLDETSEGAAYVLAFGLYNDEFEKCADGKWRFKLRSVEMENKAPMPRKTMSMELRG